MICNPIGRPILLWGPQGDGTTFAELAADFAAVVTVPVYATLLSVPFTVRKGPLLGFSFTSTWRHVGAFAGNAAVNFLFDLDGVQLPGGLTDNQVRSQIGSTARVGQVAVTPGPHTFRVRISKFGAVGNTLTITPVALPDLDHCALFLQELAG